MNNLFIVISAAIPSSAPLNCLATKVIAVCTRASVAESLCKYWTNNQNNIVYGLQCRIYTSVVELKLEEELKDSDYEAFVVITAAIPVQRNSYPLQSNVHSVHLSREKAVAIAGSLMQNNKTNVKNTPCEIHSSIIPIKITRS